MAWMDPCPAGLLVAPGQHALICFLSGLPTVFDGMDVGLLVTSDQGVFPQELLAWMGP